ncbi:hypothetical protein KI387_003458, partial [Taxus chinensis]
MFKKASDAKALQRLSGADRKKLRRNIRERFSLASDADIDVIFPPKAEITIAKLTNRVHVYAVEGGPPIVFDVDGRGTDIFPTVYALWKAPNLLPSFVLKGGEVSRFVIGGADLMFPGISIPPEGLPSFSVGEAWSVKVPGNTYPIAVGATYTSSAEASKAGLRGKALRITHYYRDTLWESAEGRYIPNEGFLEDVVLEDPAYVVASQATGRPESEVINSPDHLQRGIGNDGDTSVQGPKFDPGNETTVLLSAEKESSEQVAKGLEELKVADSIEEEASSGKSQSASLTVEETDALLDKCFLQALHTTVKDKDLPMPGSTLWSNHILACRPPGITLDIKKSSPKKLSKWLQAKSSHGLEKLVKSDNKAMIVLDATLCDALYNGTVKKGLTYPTEIHKKDLGATFLNRMQSNHRVTRGNESAVRKGALKTIQIMTERRQGNKKVTRVSGIESFLIDADALASELQKKFACSTSVAELP